MKSEILGTSAFVAIALVIVLWSNSEKKETIEITLDGCEKNIVFHGIRDNEILYFGDSIQHIEAPLNAKQKNEGLLIVDIPQEPIPNPGNDIDYWWRVRCLVGDSTKRLHYDYNLKQDVIHIQSDKYTWKIYQYCPYVFLAYYEVE